MPERDDLQTPRSLEAPEVGDSTLSAVGHGATVPLSHYLDDLSEDEITRVYLAVLRDPAPSRARLLAQGIPGDMIDRTIRILHWRGFIDISRPDHWTVSAPDIAIRAYASAVEGQARRARAAADGLASIYRATRTDEEAPPSGLVRELESDAEVVGALSQIMSRATGDAQVLRAAPDDVAQAEDIVVGRADLIRQAIESGLRITSVYDSAFLDAPGTLAALRARRENGEQVRLAPRIPFSVMIVGGQAAVIDVRPIDPTGRGSLLIEGGPLVSALSRLFEHVRDEAVPLPSAEPPTDGDFSERDHTILALLASGATDTIITRQVGVSQRTIERRIRHLMDVLGAETRFQAGVEACRRGLV